MSDLEIVDVHKGGEYLVLVAWSGKVAVLDQASKVSPLAKATTSPSVTLRKLFDCDPGEWLADFTAFRERWRLAGSGQAVRNWLDRHQRHWMRRAKRRRRGTESAPASVECGTTAF